MTPEFRPWPKIPRFNRGIVVTEKIDGTNACVIVDEDGAVHAQSRTRLITPEQDNYGFARWAQEHCDELRELGPGYHYGEWWGSGIQRGYSRASGERTFSLFNTARWRDDRPACCSVVPELYRGGMEQDEIDCALARLRHDGSVASPGFRPAEGVVVFHIASRTAFKIALDNDAIPKGA